MVATEQQARMAESAEFPLVSVVIATYLGDRLEYLREAVESSRAQTLTDIEILVACDGPLEAPSEAYLDALALADPRVRTVKYTENRGPAYARNAAIGLARAEYVAILDADDRSKPERLARQLAFLRKTGADVAGSLYDLIDGAGNVVGKKEVPLEPEAIRRALCVFNPIANSTVLAKTQILRAHPYDERFRYGEDYALWVELARRGITMRNQPESLVEFRVDPGFFERRRGWHPFYMDLRNKLRAVPVQGFYHWPWAIAASFATASVRLMPKSLVIWLYRVRGHARYS
jgi:glycosyltransferase involved in cell wall biosynthesis